VAGGRGSRNRSRPRARAATAAVQFPRSVRDRRLELSRIAPSGRSLLTGFAILALGVGLYAIARTTSAFAVRTVAVEGASPEVAGEVRKALAPAVGESLLAVDLADLSRRAQQVPMVESATFDRSFPHTLRIAIVPQVPVAVLRQGAASWLVAAGGRVVAELDRGAHSALPRVWLTRAVQVVVGEKIRGLPLRALAAVTPLVERPLPFRVTASVASGTELTLKLRSGLELRLGDAVDLPLKLEVARRVLPSLAGAQGYLDVSVPERPVAGETLNSKVEGES
jgi:cell division protein FtsQ